MVTTLDPTPLESAWLAHHVPRPDARTRLFCFGYAGIGASLFKGWGHALPDDIEVCPVQLPGRETRAGEPFLTDLHDIVEEVAAAIDPLLDRPFAFYGHSLGGLVAFELARELGRLGDHPTHLFAVASPAPHRPLRRAKVHDGPDEGLVAYLDHLGGTPGEVLDHRLFRAIYLPILRADLTAYETYVHEHGAPLPCPITAIGGDADPHVFGEDVTGWGEHTSAGFREALFPGGHFFVRDHLPAVQARVAEALR